MGEGVTMEGVTMGGGVPLHGGRCPHGGWHHGEEGVTMGEVSPWWVVDGG